MTTSHLKAEVEPNAETSCIKNMPQTMDNVQHGVSIRKQSVTCIQEEASSSLCGCRLIGFCDFSQCVQANVEIEPLKRSPPFFLICVESTAL
jgi:hypothetical protein